MARSIFLNEMETTDAITTMAIGAAAALAAKKMWDIHKNKKRLSKYGVADKEPTLSNDVKYYTANDMPEVISRATEVKK